jgi:phosphatidylinositol mannoside-binding LppM-like protein
VAWYWQDVRVTDARPHRGGSRVLAMTAGLVAVGLLASGCVRAHASLAVSSSDLVSGDVLIAALPTAEAPKGPQVDIPTSMANRVTVKPYDRDGYAGHDVVFHDLSFTEITALANSISGENASYHITFQRSGDLVTMSGSVDLTQLPTTGVDVQLKVDFPGPVTHSDGTANDDVVSWTMKAGGLTSFTATDQYALGNSRSWRFWALSLGGGTAIVSAFILLLALWARRRNLKKERAYAAAAPAI